MFWVFVSTYSLLVNEDFAYDWTSASYHILTIDGSLGRDTLGSAHYAAPASS